jgi:hypothetical protein
VNARVEEAEQFGIAESNAAAKELMRQRLITFTKSGMLWLEKSALSTRLSYDVKEAGKLLVVWLRSSSSRYRLRRTSPCGILLLVWKAS